MQTLIAFQWTLAAIGIPLIFWCRIRRKAFERRWTQIALELEEYRKKGQILNAKAALGRLRELFKSYTGSYPD